MVKGVDYPVSLVLPSEGDVQELTFRTLFCRVAGARNGIWSSLELLLYVGVPTCGRSDVRETVASGQLLDHGVHNRLWYEKIRRPLGGRC